MQQQVHNLRQQQQEQYQRQQTLYQQQQEQQQHLHQLHQQNQQLQQELQRQQHLLHQQRPYPTSPGPRLTPSMTHTEPHLTSLQQARILQARLKESFRVAILYETALAQRAVRAPREAELRAFFAPVAGTVEQAIEQIMAYGRDAEQAVFFRAMGEEEQRFLIEWQALCEPYDPVQHLEETLKDLMRRYGDDLHSPRIVGAWEAYEIGMASFKERVKRFAALCGW
jgi:delta 1-pyrroline-5-carboxylate dehydrogenase